MFRVMLVDDEPLALMGLKCILDWEEYGLEVCAACTSSEEALAEARKLRPDALFTDIYMPGMSGMELYTAMRQEGIRVELVIVSAYSDFEVARSAIDNGALSYLLKPLQEEDVKAVALRLREKLLQRGGDARIIFRMDSEEEQAVAAAALARNPLGEVMRVVAGDPEALARLGETQPNLPIYVHDVDETLLLVSCDSEALLEGCFASPAFSSPNQLGEMTRRAIAAYQGQFFYTQDRRIADIQYYIASHFAEELSLGSISAKFFLSPSYLSNCFKKHTGQNLVSFINHVRLHNACILLSRTNTPLKALALSAGFNDYSYFNKLFRAAFGTSPEQYRKEHSLP